MQVAWRLHHSALDKPNVKGDRLAAPSSASGVVRSRCVYGSVIDAGRMHFAETAKCIQLTLIEYQ